MLRRTPFNRFAFLIQPRDSCFISARIFIIARENESQRHHLGEIHFSKWFELYAGTRVRAANAIVASKKSTGQVNFD